MGSESNSIEIPSGAVQGWCWKCKPKNPGNWRDLSSDKTFYSRWRDVERQL